MGFLKTYFGTPTPDEFAELFIDALRAGGETDEIRYDREAFKIVVGEEGQNFYNLGNLYHEFCRCGFIQRRLVVKRFARLRSELAEGAVPPTFREAQRNLLPRVRETAYYGGTRLYAELHGLGMFDFAYRTLTDELAVELVYDRPDSIAMIGRETLEEWGVGFDLALDVALQNLAERSSASFRQPVRGLYVSPWQDNHDASRLVLLDLIRDLPVDGDPVAMVPNRDHLLVTGTNNRAGLEKMAELVETAMGEPRFMTGLPVRLAWDRWEPFRLPREHPLRARFELLRVQSQGHDYAEQKELLEAIHDKTGEDVFVASYTATQDEEGEIVTHCVWSEGVRSLLPRTDRIFFYSPRLDADDPIVAAGSWDRVREVVGDRMAPQGALPERYLVDSFPSEDELAAIGNELVAA